MGWAGVGVVSLAPCLSVSLSLCLSVSLSLCLSVSLSLCLWARPCTCAVGPLFPMHPPIAVTIASPCLSAAPDRPACCLAGSQFGHSHRWNSTLFLRHHPPTQASPSLSPLSPLPR